MTGFEMYTDEEQIKQRRANLASCSYSYPPRLGPREPTDAEILDGNVVIERIVEEARRRLVMHYRNGREAKNGDKIVMLESGGKVAAYGVLHSAVPGNDHCNGNIATIQPINSYACLCDCLHVDDVAGILTEKGLDKRPAGK